MTLVASHLEALIAARVGATGARLSLPEVGKPLARYSPVELTPAAWQDRLAEVVSDLRARDILDARHRLREPGELARRIGKYRARTWRQLAEQVLPGLGLGIAADDGKAHARLAGRDAWAAAIAGRVLALWHDGLPPSLTGLCDALVWRELGLPGKPKPCPAEVRGVFLQRQLHGESGPPERLVRVLAAREVSAPTAGLEALRDALVRGWLAGRTLGPDAPAHESSPAGTAPDGPGEAGGPGRPGREDARAVDDGSPPTARGSGVAGAEQVGEPAAFAHDVLRAAGETRDGWFGERKVFVSAVWHTLRQDPSWAALPLDEFKLRLVAAHRAGALVLARADFVAAMDPALVAASEIVVDGASFHFLVKEPVT